MSKVVNGITALEDSRMASVNMACSGGVWSPCGRFIATYVKLSEVSTVEVRDANTLEIVSVLKPPDDRSRLWCRSVAFSPDGHLLAGGYFK